MCLSLSKFGLAAARGGPILAGMDERTAELIARSRRLVAQSKDLCAQAQEARLQFEHALHEMREVRLACQEIRRQTFRRTPFTLRLPPDLP